MGVPAHGISTDLLTPLGAYLRLLTEPQRPAVDALGVRDRRLLHMLVAQVATPGLATKGPSIQDAVDVLWEHPQVRTELVELCHERKLSFFLAALYLSSHSSASSSATEIALKDAATTPGTKSKSTESIRLEYVGGF